jgi:hypothetical protein
MIIKPILSLPPEIIIHPPYSDAIERITSSGLPFAVDIETTGLDSRGPNPAKIISIAISSPTLAVAVDCREPEYLNRMINILNHNRWFAYNTTFDGQHLVKLGVDMNSIVGDAYIMYKLCATEKFLGQRWDLNTAIHNVLGWPESSKETFNEKLKAHKLTKADMWKMIEIDRDAFLTYNALDAAAAAQIMYGIRAQAPEAIIRFHDRQFLTSIKLTIEQKLQGMEVDTGGLHEYKAELEAKIMDSEQRFYNHPKVRDWITNYNQGHEASRIIRSSKTIRAKKSDLPWESDGWSRVDKPTKAAWESERGVWERTVVTTKLSTKLPKRFNIGSPKDRVDLFYNSGIFKWHITRDPDPTNPKSWLRLGQIEILTEDDHAADWDMTDKGGLPADGDALSFFGEPGRLYIEWMDYTKKLQFVESLLSAQHNNVLYPDVKMFSTVTTRVSGDGGKVSISILPKDEKYLKCLKARVGHQLFHLDFASLEAVILAELSGDKLLHEVYASGKCHDIFLYMAIKSGDPKATEINAIYNIDNPTKESVAAAKKQFKDVRQKWKVIVYMSCVAKDSLIRVKGKGFKHIQDISNNDIVWNGFEWTPCGGAIQTKVASCINVEGEWLTSDHRIKTSKGWCDAKTIKEESTSQLIRPNKPSASWADVWHMAGSIIRSCITR